MNTASKKETDSALLPVLYSSEEAETWRKYAQESEKKKNSQQHTKVCVEVRVKKTIYNDDGGIDTVIERSETKKHYTRPVDTNAMEISDGL